VIVERTDFISVPVTDMERATRFYRDTLGLEQVTERGFPEFQLGENVSVYLLDMEKIGSSFSGPHTAHVALRVPDVEEARRELLVPPDQRIEPIERLRQRLEAYALRRLRDLDAALRDRRVAGDIEIEHRLDLDRPAASRERLRVEAA